MLLDWLRTRRDLLAELNTARARNAQADLELDDLADENHSLKRQLIDARIEAMAVKEEADEHRAELAEARPELARLRAELAELKTSPLYQQLQDAQRHAASLAARLDEITQRSIAQDVPLR
ncbi:hypothetical protein MF672_038985 [Actinomadura sp. ATCC 31491]|uniref:Uncharacterized protein n=1 Tax=Actinomadura luzonensis TaxID=2805427 RepID=A0ABT0G549_9ACTN|nr:hypothetical protein [Actinomadura luzonensis]MCK2219740.1 hypothetical protein [Actinomadura luzonensis]